MPGNVVYINDIKGLSKQQVPLLQQRFGKNSFTVTGVPAWLRTMAAIVQEPMALLLIISCTLYFILGQASEGILLAIAILFVAAISVYQDTRSARALKALQQFSEPKVIVVRDGQQISIAVEELVPGDIIVLDEGSKVPADATILKENDLTVNESVITGESLPVEKDESTGKNLLYQGSIINSGSCYAQVTATGNETVLGKLGKQISTYHSPKTLLQLQMRKFTRRFTFFGLGAFVLIWMVNYYNSGLLAQSLLLGLTLAMAAIPEEIPVAFSSFMALGAYRMAKLGIISRQPQTIENLGSVSIICLDKTGTITENRMEVKTVYVFDNDILVNIGDSNTTETADLLRYAVLASEMNPYDAMEKAIHQAYAAQVANNPFTSLTMVYEYNLQGKPPMMTHVYQYNNIRVVAGKGAAEKIIEVCRLDDTTKTKINRHIKHLATKGYRVIGVASAIHDHGEMPLSQEAFNWKFEGLLALYDPPKKNIAKVFQQFYDAKIDIMLLTGDYPETAVTIAAQVGMKGHQNPVTGDKIMAMDPTELLSTIKTVKVYARMFPEAKLKVIEALKAAGEIVAMTGDGVNDGPALKAADIGIAMGQKGSEMARVAADLVLTDDDPVKITEAIRQGRKIFNNLKKAVRYIISIHIPIILTASLPLLLGWKYPTIFSPVHIIFLELIMGPTCSIFFEREPAEENDMWLPPRVRTINLFRHDELLISIVQGSIITAGVLILYAVFMNEGHSLEKTRAIVFTTLVLSNIFLTFTNRSFTENITRTIRYKNNLAPWIIVFSSLLLAAIHIIPFVRDLFGFSPITLGELGICAGVAFASVAWFEGYKANLKDVAPGI